jgi:mono/diheme cytochrome c family protein
MSVIKNSRPKQNKTRQDKTRQEPSWRAAAYFPRAVAKNRKTLPKRVQRRLGLDGNFNFLKMKMKIQLVSVLVLTAALLAGCGVSSKSSRGVRVPDGNPEKGKAAFLALSCHTCHQVDGVELPPPASPAPFTVLLGGEVSRLRTTGELAASIAHPSDKFSEGFEKRPDDEARLSPMPEYGEAMTIAQLGDIVAFLKPRYWELNIDFPYY